MDLNRLRLFRDVARRGSIAAAARLAGYDASAVSRSVAALEADLGVRLLQRTTRRVELTEAGESFLRRIEPVLDELAAAREEVSGLVGSPQGRLRITASNAFGQVVLAPALPTFRHGFPNIDLELVLTDAVLDLVAEQIDVAFRLGPRPSGDLVVARLMPVRMRVVASPDYLRASTTIRSPTDLAGHACLISVARPAATWVFRDGDRREDVSVPGRIATSNTLLLRQCALDGLGVAMLADWLVDLDIAAGRLTLVLPTLSPTAGDGQAAVWVAYPSRSFLPAKTRALIEHMRSQR